MKPLQDHGDTIKSDKKLLKPQVERLRRERMNNSLDSLKTMLQLGTEYQSLTKRRVEKAEILEHTVQFLQRKDGDSNKSEDEDQHHSYQEGFSTCLQRAASFLGPREGLQLKAAQRAIFGGQLTNPVCKGTEAASQANCSDSRSNMRSCQSVPRIMMQGNSRLRQHVCALYKNKLSNSNKLQIRRGLPNISQGPRTPDDKQGQSQNPPADETLWRPWS